MFRLFCAGILAAVVSCTPETPPSQTAPAVEVGPPEQVVENEAGQRVRLVPKIYWISNAAGNAIPHRVLDAVNAVRAEKDLPEVALSRKLTAAARTHSRDMSVQVRLWHFGSDGSSPIDRAVAAGFEGRIFGENISESFESDLDTMAAWMRNSESRRLILEPEARLIGIGWHQESKGKIWWTLVIGT